MESSGDHLIVEFFESYNTLRKLKGMYPFYLSIPAWYSREANDVPHGPIFVAISSKVWLRRGVNLLPAGPRLQLFHIYSQRAHPFPQPVDKKILQDVIDETLISTQMSQLIILFNRLKFVILS
jgi:hypothetical protein